MYFIAGEQWLAILTEFRRHCQGKGITDFYIRLSPISEQVDTKVISHYIVRYNL